MKDLPEMPKSQESKFIDALGKVFSIIFPPGNYLWYGVFIIMFVGLSLFGIMTVSMLGYLDMGQIIQTDTFVAVMPFTTSHMQTPLSLAVIGFLTTLWSYLMSVFMGWILISAGIDVGYAGLKAKERHSKKRDTL